MKKYDGLVIIRPDMETEEQKELYQKIQENIKKYKGDIQDTEEWGKKKLSYKIGRYRDGFYYLLRFNIDPAQVKLLNRDFKLNEAVIRAAVTLRGE